MESLKQGSACLGLRSNTTCVLGALNHLVSELSCSQKKLVEVNTRIGVGIAGLTADAQSLVKYRNSDSTSSISTRLWLSITQAYVFQPYAA
jgi:20S proteasome subunit alpha 6